MGYSLVVDLIERDLEYEAHDRCKGFVVRSRLKRVPDEAMKCNFVREEEMQRFPHRYIDFVNVHVLRSSRKIRDAFRVHFHDRFARLTDLPLQEFRRYLADFPSLR